MFYFYVWGIFLLRLERKTVQHKTHESSGNEMKSKLTKLLLGWHYKCSLGSKCPLTNEGTAQPVSLHVSGSTASTIFSQREITGSDAASSFIPEMWKECYKQGWAVTAVQCDTVSLQTWPDSGLTYQPLYLTGKNCKISPSKYHNKTFLFLSTSLIRMNLQTYGGNRWKAAGQLQAKHDWSVLAFA